MSRSRHNGCGGPCVVCRPHKVLGGNRLASQPVQVRRALGREHLPGEVDEDDWDEDHCICPDCIYGPEAELFDSQAPWEELAQIIETSSSSEDYVLELANRRDTLVNEAASKVLSPLDSLRMEVFTEALSAMLPRPAPLPLETQNALQLARDILDGEHPRMLRPVTFMWRPFDRIASGHAVSTPALPETLRLEPSKDNRTAIQFKVGVPLRPIIPDE